MGMPSCFALACAVSLSIRTQPSCSNSGAIISSSAEAENDADAVEVVEADAGREHELAVARLVEEHGGLLELERVADALADRVEHLGARAAGGQLGRDAQQVLDGGAMAGGRRGELAVLDHARGDRGDGGDDLERALDGAAAVDRVVEREEGERTAVGRGERHEQGVVGVPGVRARRGRRCPCTQVIPLPSKSNSSCGTRKASCTRKRSSSSLASASGFTCSPSSASRAAASSPSTTTTS